LSPHSPRLQSRWKLFNSNPVYELLSPLVLSPLLSVDVALLPIDSKILNLLRPFGRPLLLLLEVVPPCHHHRDI
jgi:hypothetical protein